MANSENKKKQFLKEVIVNEPIKYDVLDVWETLKLGTPVCLILEGNKCKVSMRQGAELPSIILGELTETDSKDLLPYLRAGWEDDLFECRVSYKNADTPNHNIRLSVAIYVTPPPKREAE